MLLVFGRVCWLLLVLTLIEPSEEKEQTVELRFHHDEESNQNCAVHIHGAGRSNRADYTRSVLFGRRYHFHLQYHVDSIIVHHFTETDTTSRVPASRIIRLIALWLKLSNIYVRIIESHFI